MTVVPEGPVPNQPVTGEPNTPPVTPPAPPPPPAHTPSAADVIGGLQQSLDGLGEGLINGMKEAFPVLSQPPQAPAAGQAAQVEAAGQAGQQIEPPAEKKDGRSRLAKAWFG